jgi:glucokinase
MAASKPFIGIDLGGTNMQIGLVSPGMKMLAGAKRKTKADEGLDAVVDRIISGIQEACDAGRVAVTDLAAIGIGAPGAVDPVKGVVLEAVNLRWDNVPIAAILTKKLKVRAFLDNDVNVAVLGENRLGAGKNAKDLLGVWVGTGIGGGLILNGQLYYGAKFSAGEIGHTILHPGLSLGDRTLENACSRTAIVDRLVRLIRSNHKSRLAADLAAESPSKIKSKTLATYYHSGPKPDKLVCQVIDHAAVQLGIAISNVVTLLSLSRVVLGGGLTEALGKPFVQRVEQSAREHAFPAACRKVEVVESALADAAGVFGAAMIAQERLRKK